MAKAQKVHNEWFQTVLRGGRKTCPTCKSPLEGRAIWSWGEYSNAKFRAIQDFCKSCYRDTVYERLKGHTTDCGCAVQMTGKGCRLPYWLENGFKAPMTVVQVEDQVGDVHIEGITGFDGQEGFGRSVDCYSYRFDCITLYANGDISVFDKGHCCFEGRMKDPTGCIFETLWNIAQSIHKGDIECAVEAEEAFGLDTLEEYAAKMREEVKQ